MTSLFTEDVILKVASGVALDARVQEIDVDKINCTDITVNGTINVHAVGTIVFANVAQSLNNKSIIDNSNAFVDATDHSIKVFFDAAGLTGTKSTLQFVQSANRIYTVPNASVDCQIVITEGAQTINGAKTFTNLLADNISEATINNGVHVDNIRLREDTLVTPPITVDSLSSVGSASNISIALVPKGTGALLTAIPDNTAVGGITRGQFAVDLQMVRGDLTNVASGDASGILCGDSNTASGTTALVCGGAFNIASLDYSFIGGGRGNNNRSTNGVICGGTLNATSGSYAVIPGGNNCAANGDYTYAIGNRAKSINQGSHVIADSTNADISSTLNDQYSARFAGGYQLTGGAFSLNNREITYSAGTGNTVGAITTDIYTLPTLTNQILLYTARIVAATAAGDTAVFLTSVNVKNIAGALTIGAPFNTGGAADAAINSASIAFIVSGTHVIIRGTGVAGQTINWSGAVVEVSMTF